jgi:predicted esterase
VAGPALSMGNNSYDTTIVQEQTLQTLVSGRYLLQFPSYSGPAPLFVGFHGYGQTAEDELELLCAIPGSESWLCCSIEALHPVYTSKGNAGSSWMTSRQRDQRIVENVRYVDSVIRQVMQSCTLNDRLCFHGFSQGSGMACRAALLGSYQANGLMLLGGDIPPELSVNSCISLVHLARGNRDRLYTQEQYEHDYARLGESGVSVKESPFSGGHGANEEYFYAASDFLAKL